VDKDGITQKIYYILKTLFYQIYDHPVSSGICGSVLSFTFSMINIPETTATLELVGVIIKDIGILCGSTIAVASLFSYASKNWFKKNNTNEGSNS